MATLFERQLLIRCCRCQSYYTLIQISFWLCQRGHRGRRCYLPVAPQADWPDDPLSHHEYAFSNLGTNENIAAVRHSSTNASVCISNFFYVLILTSRDLLVPHSRTGRRGLGLGLTAALKCQECGRFVVWRHCDVTSTTIEVGYGSSCNGSLIKYP